jgi:hypothetical protein
MSLTDPTQPGRVGLVSDWYAEPAPRPQPFPDLDVADVTEGTGAAKRGAHVMEEPNVEDVARRVVKRMLDAEHAMLRHLEALEAEAARRTDLLLAQAELDAELIRLNARREAHRIAMAGLERVRAELPAGVAIDATGDTTGGTTDPDQRTLDELTDSLSRFADEVDALQPSEPSHRAGV